MPPRCVWGTTIRAAVRSARALEEMVFDAREYVDAAGLMSYGPNIDAIYRQLAGYANRLLHGARPGELPIERPTLFELMINKRTADTIDVTLPPDLLARSDTVIE